MRPPRRRLTTRALIVATALVALDLGGIARAGRDPAVAVLGHQARNVRAISLLGVPAEPDRGGPAWGLDPVGAALGPVAGVATCLLAFALVLLYAPRPLAEVAAIAAGVALLAG